MKNYLKYFICHIQIFTSFSFNIKNCESRTEKEEILMPSKNFYVFSRIKSECLKSQDDFYFI